MTIETPTPSEMESMIASAKASSNAEMTAAPQMPSEPEQRLAKAIEGVSERLLVGVLKGELLTAYAHAEGLQAECERQKKISLQIMEAADGKVERAERKLAEAVAALRKFSEHCPHCKAVVDEATK